MESNSIPVVYSGVEIHFAVEFTAGKKWRFWPEGISRIARRSFTLAKHRAGFVIDYEWMPTIVG